MVDLITVVRYGVFTLFAVALAAATASWLVRTERVSPFSPLGRGLKAFSDPVLKPVEARLFRAGGNPVHAGWWLVIGVAVVGIIGLSLFQWLLGVAGSLRWAAGRGVRGVIAMTVEIASGVVIFALFARVIMSWFGIGRYTRWMRPAYWLTDWLVEPIRRVLPPWGMFDWSPMVALVALWLLKAMILAVL
jgi:YggT family protein